MPAWLEGTRTLGAKTVTVFQGNPARGLPVIAASVLLLGGLVLLLSMLKQRDLRPIPTDEPLRVPA